MDVLTLAPSEHLRVFRYSDSDQFQQVVRSALMQITPLVRKIDSRNAVLHLDGCTLYLSGTFERIIDMQVEAGCTHAVFSMAEAPAIVNGWERDRPTLTILQPGHGTKSIQKAPVTIATMVFRPPVQNRQWPLLGKSQGVFIISQQSMARLRALTIEIFQAASLAGDAFAGSDVASGVKETLLNTFDSVLADYEVTDIHRIVNHARHSDVIDKLEALLSLNVEKSIYSDDVAKALGLSTRTLHAAVVKYRGMSLHRYLRLKRVQQVRKNLLTGTFSVKYWALAHGFWHMGDFSHLYRSTFGELPSHTLAAGKLRRT